MSECSHSDRRNGWSHRTPQNPTTQDDVFDRVGREAVQSALSGYNATIFAYGQVRV